MQIETAFKVSHTWLLARFCSYIISRSQVCGLYKELTFISNCTMLSLSSKKTDLIRLHNYQHQHQVKLIKMLCSLKLVHQIEFMLLMTTCTHFAKNVQNQYVAVQDVFTFPNKEAAPILFYRNCIVVDIRKAFASLSLHSSSDHFLIGVKSFPVARHPFLGRAVATW